MFGSAASEAVAGVLRGRRIEVIPASYVHRADDDGLIMTPGDRPLVAGAVIALPAIDGPRLPGLPADEEGFIPIDDHARVAGVDGVYAAGDGTTFPIKQGGIGTQQADAAAEDIAARLGAEVDARPFHPVLRGQLITGVESLHLQHDVTGGHGEGRASPDYLWWPPHKVGGRYLAAWIAHERPQPELKPPGHPLDVEVAVPHEWHGTPMTLDRLDGVDSD
jgi:sulfide:quinone oxidoreductase